jgi:hypothetical protein
MALIAISFVRIVLPRVKKGVYTLMWSNKLKLSEVRPVIAGWVA